MSMDGDYLKRSEVNWFLAGAARFVRKMNFMLPPFAYWSPAEWATKGSECDEI